MVVKAKVLLALTGKNTLREKHQLANQRLMISLGIAADVRANSCAGKFARRSITPIDLAVRAALSHALNEILEGGLSDHAVELRMKILRHADLIDGNVVDLPIIA